MPGIIRLSPKWPSITAATVWPSMSLIFLALSFNWTGHWRILLNLAANEPSLSSSPVNKGIKGRIRIIVPRIDWISLWHDIKFMSLSFQVSSGSETYGEIAPSPILSRGLLLRGKSSWVILDWISIYLVWQCVLGKWMIIECRWKSVLWWWRKY